jgi:hypothetical protein
MNANQSGCRNKEGDRTAAENSVPGLNDNIEFMGRQLHIQTERAGYPAPHIVTQVFSNGRVVFSRKSDITLCPASQELARVQELMRTQHFQIIQEMAEKQKRILGSR